MKKIAERAEYPLNGVKYAEVIKLYVCRGGGEGSTAALGISLQQFPLTVEESEENCFPVSTNLFFLT